MPRPARPLTPEEALALAKNVADIYGDASTQLLAVIARAAARGMDRPQWAEQALANSLALRADAQRILHDLQHQASTATVDALEQAYTGGLSPGRGLTGINRSSVLALARDTERLTTAVQPMVLRWVDDTYRQVVADTVGAAVIGGVDRRAVAARALDRFAAAGVGGFTDGAGRRWTIDTYAEMATRTAVGRAHLAGTLDRFAQDGREYVIVSDSPEECPQCRPFEGRVLSLGADVPPETGEAGPPYAGTLTSARSAGLFHPNCTHRLGAYIPGLTRAFDGPTENPDGYRDRQRQRQLERRVRESKRRIVVAKAIGDPAVLQRQRALLNARRTALEDFNTVADRKAWVSAKRTRIGAGPLIPDEPEYDEITRLLGLTRQVHTHPDLPTVAVRRVHQPSEPGLGASYRFGGPKPHTPAGRYPVTLAIDINDAATFDTSLSVVHEFGHLLDHRGLGADPERFASAYPTSEVADVMAAVDRSDARLALTHLRQTTTDPELAEHLAYLADPRELFARAYAQWIAVRTGDRRLLVELRKRQASPMPYQWDDDDFTTIATALDGVFRRRGLLREG